MHILKKKLILCYTENKIAERESNPLIAMRYSVAMPYIGIGEKNLQKHCTYKNTAAKSNVHDYENIAK